MSNTWSWDPDDIQSIVACIILHAVTQSNTGTPIIETWAGLCFLRRVESSKNPNHGRIQMEVKLPNLSWHNNCAHNNEMKNNGQLPARLPACLWSPHYSSCKSSRTKHSKPILLHTNTVTSRRLVKIRER